MEIKVYVDKLNACEVCDHCAKTKYPWFTCLCNNEKFGKVDNTNDCEEFELAQYDDDFDEDDDDFYRPSSIECPRCGSDAYDIGNGYECDNCGWVE